MEGRSLPGKEKESLVGRMETGMSVGMSLDDEQMKLLEPGSEVGTHWGWGEWSQTWVKKRSWEDWREKPGGGGRKVRADGLVGS